MGRFLQRLLAVLCAWTGRIAFRLGRHRHARRQFERVLRLGGDEFVAYVHLGRIALGEGDFAGYRREMGNARACDPERFARLRPAADGIETRAAGTPFEETGERATWRSVRPGPGLSRRTPVRSAELPTENHDDSQRLGPLFELPLGLGEYGADPRPRRRRDDFCSNSERERFRGLPAIRREDVRTADYDELARRLGG